MDCGHEGKAFFVRTWLVNSTGKDTWKRPASYHYQGRVETERLETVHPYLRSKLKYALKRWSWWSVTISSSTP